MTRPAAHRFESGNRSAATRDLRHAVQREENTISFRVSGLDPTGFEHLFGLPDDGLATHGARRLVTGTEGSMPDRIELRDARPGETVILVNHVHQPADTPFRASHAVYVLEGGGPATRTGRCDPPALRTRLLSIRAFDEQGMMIDADVSKVRTLRC